MAAQIMRAKFDVFARLSDGTPILIGSFDDLEQARHRLKELARDAVGDCFIYSEEKGITELVVYRRSLQQWAKRN
jgi:hypothetical protein